MSQPSVAADVPVLPRRIALASAAGVAGLVALAVVLAVSSSPFSTAIACIAYAILWGVGCWAVQRRSMQRLWDSLIRVDAPGDGDWRRGILLDLAMVGAVAMTALRLPLLCSASRKAGSSSSSAHCWAFRSG